jgi:two-component system chemotaxis response regulator CheB
MARAMAQVKVVRHWSANTTQGREPPQSDRRTPESADLIAIAASTGGPPALRRILIDLPRTLPAPILIVQHIARDFTVGFVEWLAGSCALPVKIAREGESLVDGVVYIAPDDTHLGVTRHGRIKLGNSPPVSGFRPSATHMFESAGVADGSRLIAVVLTGLGSDGADGLEIAHAAGSYVIAQDEASSVVFGMAAEAVRRGAVDIQLPIGEIAKRLVALVTRSTHGR